MMRWLHNIIAALLYPLLRVLAGAGVLLGRLHPRHLRKYKGTLRPGDVLVTRADGAITNAAIPGHFKHAAMYVGTGEIVEATYPTVRIVPLSELLGRVDEYRVLRAKFATEGQAFTASVAMRALVGKPYDLRFEDTAEAFYCSEAIWYSYRFAVPEWAFEARERIGVRTVTPQDLADASKHFQTIRSAP